MTAINLCIYKIMGNCLECIQICKNSNKEAETTPTQISFLSTYSITNASVSIKDETELDTKSTSCAYSADRLSWYQLQNLYGDLQEENEDELKLQPLVVKVMKEIFSTIENNINPMSRRFYTCLIDYDKTFPSTFEEYASRNYRSVTEGIDPAEKIRKHLIMMIYLHKIIIEYLENDNIKEAREILQLIAISHSLMKVLPTNFKFMDSVMGKFLRTNGFLFEDNAQAIVLYFNSTTNHICKYMSLQRIQDLKAGSSTKTYASIARANYRRMKKWYFLVQNLQDKIGNLAELESVEPEKPSVVSRSTIPTAILKQNACIMKYFVKNKINKNSQL